LSDNLYSRFVAAQADFEKPFLRFLDDPSLSYRETFAAAGRFAHVLAAHGVKPGDRVAVQVEKSAAALILYLACLRAPGSLNVNFWHKGDIGPIARQWPLLTPSGHRAGAFADGKHQWIN
jgi:non-ribosomal peptide synthetase component F